MTAPPDPAAMTRDDLVAEVRRLRDAAATLRRGLAALRARLAALQTTLAPRPT